MNNSNYDIRIVKTNIVRFLVISQLKLEGFYFFQSTTTAPVAGSGAKGGEVWP